MTLSVEEIRQIKAAQDAADRKMVAEGQWNEIAERAEANLAIWRKLWSKGRCLPAGRLDPRKHLVSRDDKG